MLPLLTRWPLDTVIFNLRTAASDPYIDPEVVGCIQGLRSALSLGLHGIVEAYGESSNEAAFVRAMIEASDTTPNYNLKP